MIIAFIVMVWQSGSRRTKNIARKKIFSSDPDRVNSHVWNLVAMTKAITGKLKKKREMTMTGKPFKSALVVSVSMLLAGYVILAASLFTLNAVALVFMIPVGIGCMMISLFLWLRAVVKEAKNKDLI